MTCRVGLDRVEVLSSAMHPLGRHLPDTPAAMTRDDQSRWLRSHGGLQIGLTATDERY
ncbi:MAG: hypothetical protein O6944_03720 [Gammaproteobacteria bacterium]|nr:hypothetical protein [Gammaproteobacteria bacterium]